MTFTITAMTGCGEASQGEAPWIVDRFDDIKVIRYEVPGFEMLPLEQKELIYYLSEAAKCGRDILFDQNCEVNLPVRRTLETVYENYAGDRTTPEWKALEKYLKKVWFANGIHHHYSNDKFTPEFTEGYLLDVIETIPEEKFGELNSLRRDVCVAIFDPAAYPTRLNQRAGDDLLLTSSSNYYRGVSQSEAESFYAGMAAADARDPEPVSYGLNSQLTKDETGKLVERTWRVGGLYSAAIERIVYWLEKAESVAQEPQKSNIAALIAYVVLFIAAAVAWRWPVLREIREGVRPRPDVSFYGWLLRHQPGVMPIRWLLVLLLAVAAAGALLEWGYPWLAANIPFLRDMSNYVAV